MTLHVLVLPSWFPEPHVPHSGSFFVDQALALQRAGHKVGVIYPAHRELASDVRGLDVIGGRAGYVFKAGPLNGLLFARESLRLYRSYHETRGAPDVLHVQSAVWAAFGALAIRRRYGVPFVLTEHASGLVDGRMPGWRRALAQIAAREADACVAVSTALARVIRAIEVVPNTVDSNFFQPGDAPRRGFGVLTIGNLIPRKRVDLLLRAFARAFPQDARLEIGGDGSEWAALQQLSAALGLGERIRFLGPLDRAGVRSAMQRADVFALASDHETFGVVLIEALACGLPVVATRSGGPEDIVTPEVGELVDRGDELALSAALRHARARLAGMPGWRDTCTETARLRYGYEAFACRLTPILARAAGGGRSCESPRDRGTSG